MNIEQARKLLSIHFEYPPVTSAEAKIMLANYETGNITLPVGFEAQIYLAIQLIRDQGMGRDHANDIKRADRFEGKKRRKARTGSRH